MLSIVVIVDGYSTGRYLAKAFSNKGLVCWHVESAGKKPAAWNHQLQRDDYLICSQWQHNFAQLRSAMPDHAVVVAVIAGAETGVELSDYLAAQFGVAGNAPASSTRRRDKAAMAAALRLAQLRAIADIRIDSLDAAETWLQQHQRYPVVIKPIDSAGTDGVSICHDHKQAITAIDALLGATNALGKRNHHILLQEYIAGTEYIVNTVSLDGQHYFIDAWQSRKLERHGSRIYDRETLLAPQDPVLCEQLLPYLRQALNALDVHYGPCHSELFIDAAGVVLIESGARLHGSIDPNAVRHAVGWNQLDALVELVVDPYQFSRRCEQHATRSLPRFALCVEHIASNSGTICQDAIDRIRKLPSCFCSHWSAGDRERVSPTRDLFTSLGNSYLIDADPARLEHDYQQLRQIENDLLIEP